LDSYELRYTSTVLTELVLFLFWLLRHT
jgi:hypothetical protein